MSSFAKRALIVANGELPSADILASLLSFNPFILAADGGVDKLLNRGVVANAVLGDFDTSTDNLPADILRISAPDQEYTDLDKSVSYLVSQSYDVVWIIGATGDRLDHTYGALSILLKYAQRIEISLIDNVGTAHPIEHFEEIETEIGQTVSLLTLGLVEGVKTSGLRWNLNDKSLAPGIRDGISNQAVSTLISIEKRSGPLIAYVHHR